MSSSWGRTGATVSRRLGFRNIGRKQKFRPIFLNPNLLDTVAPVRPHEEDIRASLDASASVETINKSRTTFERG
jgi:hypothetical protein